VSKSEIIGGLNDKPPVFQAVLAAIFLNGVLPQKLRQQSLDDDGDAFSNIDKDPVDS